MRRNIISFLEDYERLGDHVAFAYRRGLRMKRWTYGQVSSAARSFARELEARGVSKGDRVLLCAENSPLWVAAFFGCALRGAVLVPMDVESDASFLKRVCSQTEPKLLAHDGANQTELTGPDSFNLKELEGEGAHTLATPYKAEETGEDDLLEIIYTSGTTMEPKGVLLTHGNLLANIAPLEEEIQKYLRFERLVHPLRFLSTLPLSHVFGQLMSLFVPQLLGGQVFFQNSLSASEITETCRRERVNILVTVPRVLDILRDYVLREAERKGGERTFHEALSRAGRWSVPRRLWAFRSLHRRFGWRLWAFISGGATLQEETEEFWQRAGFAVIQGYGMTETASLITVNHPFKKSRGSIGRTLPGQQLKLSEAGEIMVRGANVSPGYWTGPGGGVKTEEGWLRTGDVGFLDEKGNLYFKGRRKDVIVTGAGLNIYPEDLEAALNAQPEVRESVVISFEAESGPEPLAVIIMREAATHVEEVVARANRLLSKHQQIRRHVIWPERDFPRTSTQKVIKREVATRVRESITSESSRPEASGSLAEIINRVAGSSRAAGAPGADLSTDLKLDSLGRVELLSALEERYQVELDEAAFTSATTLGDIERMIETGAPEEGVRPYPYPEWARRFPITWLRVLTLYLIVLPITYLLCWVRVRGKENLKDLSGPVLFVSNHISMVDHALILSALPGRYQRNLAIAMEGEILRDWVHTPEGAGLFTRLRYRAQYLLVVLFFNVFPLPKKSGFRRSFAYAGQMMDSGKSVLVFPEGTRSDDARMHSFMTGSGLLATGLSAPVVPVRIDGLYKLKQQNRRFARPGQVTVTFGRPLSFADTDDAAKVAAALEKEVREL